MPRLSQRAVFVFWYPLAATWLMMAVEGPFLAAVIARLPEAKFNLAAYGVAFAFAILVEAPVIMMMSASTALVEDARSLRELRRFNYALSALLTVLMGILALPPAFQLVGDRLIGLPREVSHLTQMTLVLLLPWPGAIGYRRFHQGLLIRSGRTRLVAYGTVVRLAAMGAAALLLCRFSNLPGALLGGAALSAGVCLEALAIRLMAAGVLHELEAIRPLNRAGAPPLDTRRIFVFYLPLALTSIIGLAVPPMVTFFMGRAVYPVESLAVLPVVNSLSFIFRALGLSYQEVGIAMLGERHRHAGELGRFAAGLSVAASAGLALIGLTPLSVFWFETVSGLSPELTRFALTPTRLLIPIPALTVLICFQRSILVKGRLTRAVTLGSTAEVLTILAVLSCLIGFTSLVGATAAAVSYVAGRAAGNLCLLPAARRVLTRVRTCRRT